jgi:putative membrane protein
VHAGRHYTMVEVFKWTRRETVLFVVIACLPVIVVKLGLPMPSIPWPPIAILGTAVAFVTGFKGNAAYNRLWEARQIWGAIVNVSRTWAVFVQDFITAPAGDGTRRRLVYRHIAWLTALRYQLREPRAWENSGQNYAVEFQQHTYSIPERSQKLDEALAAFLEPQELAHVLARKNRATAIIALQSAELSRCAAQGWLSEHRHVELGRTLSSLYEQQGKCERIKNFPYPRQYATLNLIFVWLFILLLPFAVGPEFHKSANGFWLWLCVPTNVLLAWCFHTMDKIGEATENPFEGGPNDVPITAMSRTIEIDLRDLAGETELPEPLRPTHNILM